MSALKVLLTGGSSFTGYWFVRELAAAGHDVTAVFTRSQLDAYDDELRRRRVSELNDLCRPEFGCQFGDERFLQLIESSKPDVLCHHAAWVTNYRSPEFDVARAVTNNTYQAREVIARLQSVGCQRLVISGTVFEGGEGAGSEGLPHFSPYGLSKALTAEMFRYYCRAEGMSLGKFVIPNPFGPYEEPRFTAYLVRCWKAGETPCVQTPAYVRDNLHVTLMAKHYARFVGKLPTSAGFMKTNPSGYVESQGAFAQRFARELESRLDMPCPVDLADQREFAEPRIRLNTELLDATALDWSETTAWDQIADYYAPTAAANR